MATSRVSNSTVEKEVIHRLGDEVLHRIDEYKPSPLKVIAVGDWVKVKLGKKDPWPGRVTKIYANAWGMAREIEVYGGSKGRALTRSVLVDSVEWMKQPKKKGEEDDGNEEGA